MRVSVGVRRAVCDVEDRSSRYNQGRALTSLTTLLVVVLMLTFPSGGGQGRCQKGGGVLRFSIKSFTVKKMTARGRRGRDSAKFTPQQRCSLLERRFLGKLNF